MGKILVVDDEPGVLAAFQDLLGKRGHRVTTADRADRGLAVLEEDGADLVILDVCLPEMDGLEAFRRLIRDHPKVPVIVMTGQGTTETAIAAAKLGAFDYQLKPFDPKEMLETIEKALASVRLMHQEPSSGLPSASPSTGIIGQSPVMQAVYRSIGRVAPTDATVLIRGESGTGKELVARAIYEHSSRVGQPLVVVNCVAIPETLLESELFGYERGAFTGANRTKPGKFEHASGGTIFLDEIGDIPLGTQAKILRVLQDRIIEHIGGNERIPVDVRLMAATNRNLEKAISEGTFREDLYHRLKVVTVRISPLRERREDIPALAESFLDRFSRELGIERPILTRRAMDVLLTYSWPGNVRELEHCIHRVLIFTHGYPIQAEDVGQALAEEKGSVVPPDPVSRDGGLGEVVREHLKFHTGHHTHIDFLDRAERLLLMEAMRQARGNQTQAAALLGLPRPTLHAKLQKHGVQIRG